MRKSLPYALAVAGLLLVGAGCGGAASERAATGPGPVTAPPAMKAEAPKTEIDTSVDAMLKSADDEKAVQADREKNADDVNADQANVNAYGDSSYDLQ